MTDELFVSVAARLALLLAASLNVTLALRHWMADPDREGLRGFVQAMAIFFGVVALAGTSRVLAETYPSTLPVLRWVAAIGVSGFLVSALFACATWAPKRKPR